MDRAVCERRPLVHAVRVPLEMLLGGLGFGFRIDLGSECEVRGNSPVEVLRGVKSGEWSVECEGWRVQRPLVHAVRVPLEVLFGG